MTATAVFPTIPRLRFAPWRPDDDGALAVTGFLAVYLTFGLNIIVWWGGVPA